MERSSRRLLTVVIAGLPVIALAKPSATPIKAGAWTITASKTAASAARPGGKPLSLFKAPAKKRGCVVDFSGRIAVVGSRVSTLVADNSRCGVATDGADTEALTRDFDQGGSPLRLDALVEPELLVAAVVAVPDLALTWEGRPPQTIEALRAFSSSDGASQDFSDVGSERFAITGGTVDQLEVVIPLKNDMMAGTWDVTIKIPVPASLKSGVATALAAGTLPVSNL